MNFAFQHQKKFYFIFYRRNNLRLLSAYSMDDTKSTKVWNYYDIFCNMYTSPLSFLHNLRLLHSDANQISRKDGLGITLAATDALDNAPRISFLRLRRLLLFKNLLASFRRDFMRGEFFFVFQSPPPPPFSLRFPEFSREWFNTNTAGCCRKIWWRHFRMMVMKIPLALFFFLFSYLFQFNRQWRNFVWKQFFFYAKVRKKVCKRISFEIIGEIINDG